MKTSLLKNTILSLPFCFACTLISNAQEIKTNNSYQKLISDNNQFAIEFYKQLSEKDGNIFFSPISISSALAMTYAGARSETASQMKECLRFSQSDSDLHSAFKTFLEKINRENPDYELKIANSLWPHINYKFREDFIQLLKENYFAYAQSLDYNQPQEACKIINQWVEEKTKNKIKDITSAPPVDTLTRLILVNAIYFKGKWEKEFSKNKTHDSDFYISPEKKIQCSMMTDTLKNVSYAETENAEILKIPYKGGLSMILMLPKEKNQLTQIEKTLDPAKFAEIIKNLNKEEIIVFLPKFQTTVSTTLNDYLKKLGMTDAFLPGKADFSGMDGTKELFISSILHKAFVDVNEEGTEAAAATTVIMSITALPAPPKVFRADHPFLFFICGQDGEILFTGRISDPTQSENKI